jgi:Tol biopolymer transport system component
METVEGLAWLPDGSGFAYSVVETDFFTPVAANLFRYSFATNQSTRLTSFEGSFAGDLSISPDSQRIVFERAGSLEALQANQTELWLMQMDGEGLQLLVEQGSSPAWGSGISAPLPPPVPLDGIFLPIVIKGG